ncbi:18K peptidoglycan-associated outer membrane lipoprotein - OmpA/MotB precursor [Candidatus Chlamydia sanziniae]|uniref:Peptidoglycan-associated protein n=2 Tax=Candidatus Chlamydia sanziniae TaxID=1806891 RepID=A0A1A9HWW0_9CHLA|nr:18K peptidoglycan-associated outer membrane lipoprotein - OmpA/MotB precursor [Candidatus Chlamydia sanziniae]
MNYLLRLCSLLALFALPSCSHSCYDWDDACKDWRHTKKKHHPSFGFVPLYTEDDLHPSFVFEEYDSKEEQQYKTHAQATAFHNVTFATDSYTIKGEENLAILTNLVHYMKKFPKVTLYIEGHTDERGAASYNLALGARRANAIKECLIKQGVSANRLFTISYGKEQPLSPGHNELAWQQNRRTEFKVHAR